MKSFNTLQIKSLAKLLRFQRSNTLNAGIAIWRDQRIREIDCNEIISLHQGYMDDQQAFNSGVGAVS